MSKFMQQGKDLRVQRASRIGPHAKWACAPNSPRSAFPLNFDYAGHWSEKRSFCIDRDRRVASVGLENPRDIRIPEDFHVTRAFGFLDKLLSTAVCLKPKRSKGGRWIRIFFPKPRRTGVFAL